MADIVNVGTAPNSGDGDALRNAFVKVNARLQQIAALINNRGAWTTATAYSAEARDWVVHDDQAYMAAVSHVSGVFATDLAAGRWLAVDVAQLILDLADPGAGKGAALIGYQRSGLGAVLQNLYAKLMRAEADIFEFGYVVGEDARAPIQNAINSLPVRGGTVRLPAGTLSLSGGIEIGNGNGGTSFSTRGGVKLIGSGAGFGVSGAGVPTILEYSGATPLGTPLIQVRGRISDVLIEGLLLDGKGLAAGISMRAFTGSTVQNIKVINPAANSPAIAVLGGTAMGGNYNIFNRFSNISIALFQPNSSGLYLDGDYPSINDTWLTTFELVRIDIVAGATSAVGVWARFVDSITFHRCHSDGRAEPTAIDFLLDATGNPGSLNNYPIGLASYDCSWHKIVVTEDATSKIGPNYFHGLGVNDGEVLPTHPRLWGTTANGEPFGYAPGFKDRVLADANVQNTTATTPVYTFNVGSYFLGGGDSFRAAKGGLCISHLGNYVNSSGSAQTLSVAVVLGGIALLTFTVVGIPSDASARPVTLDLSFNLGSGLVNRQVCRGTLTIGAAGSANGVAAAPYVTQVGAHSTPGAAVNTAVARDLQILVAHGAASPAVAYTAKSTVTELA